MTRAERQRKNSQAIQNQTQEDTLKTQPQQSGGSAGLVCPCVCPARTQRAAHSDGGTGWTPSRAVGSKTISDCLESCVEESLTSSLAQAICLSQVTHYTALEEQFLTFSHSRFLPFSKLGMQFRSRSTLPLLVQTSKPIKIACKGFQLISTTHFLVIQQEHSVPRCRVGPELPKHLLHLFSKFVLQTAQLSGRQPLTLHLCPPLC